MLGVRWCGSGGGGIHREAGSPQPSAVLSFGLHHAFKDPQVFWLWCKLGNACTLAGQETQSIMCISVY